MAACGRLHVPFGALAFVSCGLLIALLLCTRLLPFLSGKPVSPDETSRIGRPPGCYTGSATSTLRGSGGGFSNSSPSVIWPKVVLFGDSLTEYSFSADGNWGAVLADRLRRRCDVVPRGFRGYNTRMCRAALPAVYPSFGQPIRVATVFLGANDASGNPRQHVPLDEYADNLTWMTQFFVSRGLDKRDVILITPPMFDGERFAIVRKLSEPRTRTDTTKLYADVCVRVAEKLGCGYVDLYRLMETKFSGTWKSLLNDGLHLSANGSRVLADAVWDLIERRIGDLPTLLPDWVQMDAEDPGTTVHEWIDHHRGRRR